MPHAIITTPRLTLRQFTLADVDPLHKILHQKDILRYFPGPGAPTTEKVEKLINTQIQHWEDHGYGWWALESRDEPGLGGWMGLQYLPETNETEVGYLLSRALWGRGLATDGSIASLKFGFENFPFESLIGIVHPENIASQRVLEKSGLIFTQQTEYFGMDCYHYLIQRADFDL
jgi:RimJ/RimL family protein N-acetyltransferase